MTAHSDADLFVARIGRAASADDALLVREAIARTLVDMGMPEPSQGGAFLKMHTAESLCEQMGTPADDAANTFTARMLLLLESRPLLQRDAYARLLDAVIERYWQNTWNHTRDYQPFVLVNDIVRYWRILLLNYVAKNFEKERELEQPKRDAERRLRSCKLRFSRCLTCFSFLAELLAATAGGHVTKEQVIAITTRTPVERLRAVRDSAGAASDVDRLLDLYTTFLRETDAPKGELIARFQDVEFKNARAEEGEAFGTAMFDLLQVLGRDGRGRQLFRYMVV
jgi:hypothetical protein